MSPGNLSIKIKISPGTKSINPGDLKALCANLEDFGIEELENMHRSDELEALAAVSAML
jgi:hypothetical protein